MKNKIDPLLKFRYGIGLGDVVASILHSRILGWFTYLFTGKKEPCMQCNIRRNALNTVLPLPIWLLFFDSENVRDESLRKDMLEYGYQLATPEESGCGATNTENGCNCSENVVEHVLEEDDNLLLISSSVNTVGNLLIKTNIYQIDQPVIK